MKVYSVGDLRLEEKELSIPLGNDKIIFVGSSTDMWADGVAIGWIEILLAHCRRYPENTYVFQTKNPVNLYRFQRELPPRCLLGTTLESDINHHVSKAPIPLIRWLDMVMDVQPTRHPLFVSIEPIMDFDIETFTYMLNMINPEFVSIGADSQKHKLSEPPPEKIKELIIELRKFTKVKIKSNLKRLVPELIQEFPERG